MKARGWWLVLPVAAGFAWGVLHLFGVEFASGAVYPAYSSLRADPDGARLLYDSLARFPGLAVSRSYVPLELLTVSDATILLLGLDARKFGAEMEVLRGVRRLAERGNRVILAAGPLTGADEIPATKLNREWGVRFGVDPQAKGGHRAYFSKAEDWKVTDWNGDHPIAIERTFGKGTIRMMAASLIFDNQSTVAMDRLDALTAALGPNRRIIFDEEHFGVTESGSIVGLARQYRLTGMALGLLFCAALWIWRSTSAFPPPAAAVSTEHLTGRTSQAGLLTLLRKHIRPVDVTAVCWREWASGKRIAPEVAADAAAILKGKGSPVEQFALLSRLGGPGVPPHL